MDFFSDRKKWSTQVEGVYAPKFQDLCQLKKPSGFLDFSIFKKRTCRDDLYVTAKGFFASDNLSLRWTRNERRTYAGEKNLLSHGE